MASSVQKEMLHAIQRVLLPIVRLLLHTGISFKDFAKVAKMAYVQAATEDYGIRGRPTNVSRVAVITGLTRKEVKSIRDSGWSTNRADENWWEVNFPPSDLLHFWHTDPDFCEQNGMPLPLQFGGDFPSFTDLARRYAGDIPPGAMRVELTRTGSVAVNENGMLIPIKRHCAPMVLDAVFVQTIGYSLSRLADTVLRNAHQMDVPEGQRDGNFERYVWTQNLTDADKKEFKALSERRASELLIELDDWIGDREQRAGVGRDQANAGAPQRSVEGDCGLGFYYFGGQ
jgi:hypothetical protein